MTGSSTEYRECTDLPGGTAPPPGVPQFIGGGDTCQISNVLYNVGLDPKAFHGVDSGGIPFNLENQHYGTVELNYLPIPDLTISSTTGYYNLISRSLVNATGASFAGPPFGAGNKFTEQNFSEELRANSDFSGPLNFTFGGLFQNDHLADFVTIIGNTLLGLPPLLGGGDNVIDGRTYSVFGQGRWKIIDRLELAAGLRWTDETRTETITDLAGALVPVAVPSINSKNFSPEVTLTYHPTDDLTLFAAAKQGYKSGGFSIATPVAPGANNSFHDEKVQGGEFGLKSRWLDHQLAVNLAPYYYKYTGLQVGVISPPQNGLPVIQTVNAAAANVYGIDFDSAYHPRNPRIGIERGSPVEPRSVFEFQQRGVLGRPDDRFGLQFALQPVGQEPGWNHRGVHSAEPLEYAAGRCPRLAGQLRL